MFVSDGISSPLWTFLVSRWHQLEVDAGLNGKVLLRALHRPTAVKDWIGRGRSKGWRPEIDSAKAYCQQHTAWWMALQPEWRLSENGSIVVERVSGDWSSLRVFGSNGLLSVVASLFFWGLLVKSPRDRAQWEAAVRDCLLVMDR